MAAVIAGKPQLVVLILVNGLPGSVMVDLLGEVKNASKAIGTHKRRELYWQAYTKLGNKAQASMEDVMYGLLTFHLSPEAQEDPEQGIAEYIPATKRQRGQLSATDVMGKKFKAPDEDAFPNGWMSCWFDEEAQRAFDDLMFGEPVVYVSQDMDGVFVATRLKRRKVSGAPSAMFKSSADVEAFKATLLPDKPLVSISWTGNDPVKLNEYNFLLAGKVAKPICEDLSIVVVPSASTDEIYDRFLLQRNTFFIAEAEKLIATMLAEVGKGEKNPIANVTIKLAGIARQNGLLKKVYVDSSKAKFINAVREDGGGVEMYVINDAPPESQFMQYGGVAFELHYRADLTLFGG